MHGFTSHEEFDAWKLANDFEERIRVLLTRPALVRDSNLWIQLKKASESPCPNIAEGFARYYPRDFANFVRVAKASLAEAAVHLSRAHRKGITDAPETAELVRLAERGLKAATGLIRYLETADVPGAPPPRQRRRPRQKRREPGT